MVDSPSTRQLHHLLRPILVLAVIDRLDLTRHLPLQPLELLVARGRGNDVRAAGKSELSGVDRHAACSEDEDGFAGFEGLTGLAEEGVPGGDALYTKGKGECQREIEKERKERTDGDDRGARLDVGEVIRDLDNVVLSESKGRSQRRGKEREKEKAHLADNEILSEDTIDSSAKRRHLLVLVVPRRFRERRAHPVSHFPEGNSLTNGDDISSGIRPSDETVSKGRKSGVASRRDLSIARVK
jgi:hypothetical protein